MYIQIRTADGSQCKRVEVSKITTVDNLKKIVEEAFQIKEDKQRLFFGGKQLVDNHTIFDYNIRLNDVVLLMERTDQTKLNAGSKPELQKNLDENPVPKLTAHEYFKIGDAVDAMWDHYGAWFEGSIVEIKDSPFSSPDKKTGYETESEGDLLYAVSFDCFTAEPPTWLPLSSIRPRMSKCLPLSGLKSGAVVLVNYNILNPSERGFWYDFKAIHVSATKSILEGTLYIGKKCLELPNCSIKFTSEVFEIQKPSLNIFNLDKVQPSMVNATSCTKKQGPKCTICSDDPKCRCKSCSCFVCGGKYNAHLQIICDECDQPYHLGCLKPPLESIPEVDFWYCPKCKNDTSEIVQAGESLKESKRKRKMPSSKATDSKRDWGKGMACVGRTKQCTIVPSNHFGPIPGIEVGSSWKFRVSAAEAGVHRPPVAGIHGREGQGAFSLVLSGGYEDDKDHGEEFYYTGSGGRDLSGNKRTAKQSCDQTLSNMNLALARNCNAPLNQANGAEAEDWKKGKPVRVLRNYKAAKHSEFAPVEGNRYDGLYKVVKYFPQKGESGFRVWRYLLRRDDPAPAPWTEEGQQRIIDLGLKMIYPDGYEEVAESKRNVSSSGKLDVSCESPPIDEEPARKMIKMLPFTLSEDLNRKVEDDLLNKKLWSTCKMKLEEGKSALFEEIQRQFMCMVCQDLVVNPVTTECFHNICEQCLRRSFAAKVYTCPSCRLDLGKSYLIKVNENLRAILQSLFPAYEAGR